MTGSPTRCPPSSSKHGATHGIQWADFDGDGALDLAITNNNPGGTHYLYRNVLPPERARRSIQVMVLDHQGHATKAGSEVRIYAPGTRTVWGGRIVDSGSGYCSQNVLPVHFGLPKEGRVDVEVTALTKAGRKITRVANVDPNKLPRRVLVVKLPRVCRNEFRSRVSFGSRNGCHRRRFRFARPTAGRT